MVLIWLVAIRHHAVDVPGHKRIRDKRGAAKLLGGFRGGVSVVVVPTLFVSGLARVASFLILEHY